ncbi:hypothetical protein PVAP13_3KG073500 [Panicum virgatum]|uniref:Uncharacterized protein n=1 Tax=Panicum virgatum TaxID=38727 RepID=A0A8T0UTZ9_PANVG|nr:hypothetical protein PVAP13_3KG073500 [Panicum virgatum]
MLPARQHSRCPAPSTWPSPPISEIREPIPPCALFPTLANPTNRLRERTTSCQATWTNRAAAERRFSIGLADRRSPSSSEASTIGETIRRAQLLGAAVWWRLIGGGGKQWRGTYYEYMR